MSRSSEALPILSIEELVAYCRDLGWTVDPMFNRISKKFVNEFGFNVENIIRIMPTLDDDDHNMVSLESMVDGNRHMVTISGDENNEWAKVLPAIMQYLGIG